MIFIGDIHAQFDLCRKRMKQWHKKYPEEIFVQIGDFGLGFPKSQSADFPKYFKFIRGNHDNPEVCRNHPNYLGDFGSFEENDHKISFVGGAWSIDQSIRTEGVNWWNEEELSIAELNTAFDKYLEYKPEIMITHDGPNQATKYLLAAKSIYNESVYREESPIPTRTGQALSAMFDAYQPKLWIFGHWHTSWSKKINNTNFICLNELEFCRYDDLHFD